MNELIELCLKSIILLLLSIVHTIAYRRKLGAKRWSLLALIVVSFATGLFGMILDRSPIILILHRCISIAFVFFLAIHIFVNAHRLESASQKNAQCHKSVILSGASAESKTAPAGACILLMILS